MLSIFSFIASAVSAFGQLVLWGLISGVNLIIAGVGGLISTLMSLLPNLPDVPDNPAPDAIGYIAFFIPAVTILAFAAALIASYVALLVIRIALKWIKAL
jgi:hypothetical protein